MNLRIPWTFFLDYWWLIWDLNCGLLVLTELRRNLREFEDQLQEPWRTLKKNQDSFGMQPHLLEILFQFRRTIQESKLSTTIGVDIVIFSYESVLLDSWKFFQNSMKGSWTELERTGTRFIFGNIRLVILRVMKPSRFHYITSVM